MNFPLVKKQNKSYNQCWFATKIPLMKPQSLQTTLSEGRGEGKHFCDLVGVSILRIEKYAR